MIYILCDHLLGNALIIMATHFFFKKQNIDVTYVLSEKNVQVLRLFPNIHIPYVERRAFDASAHEECKKHIHKQILHVESLKENAYVTNWYAQRMEYLMDAPLRSVFRTNMFNDMPPIEHTVVHVRAGDIDHFDIHFQNKNTIGRNKHHFPVPIQVYDTLLNKEEPVTIVSQSEDNKYVKYLKEHFNIVRVICSSCDPGDVENKMVHDFAALQTCTETLILSCSTFAWCAGMSSKAKRVIMPSQGSWHHTNRHAIDLYPDDDRVEWFDVSTLRFLK